MTRSTHCTQTPPCAEPFQRGDFSDQALDLVARRACERGHHRCVFEMADLLNDNWGVSDWVAVTGMMFLARVALAVRMLDRLRRRPLLPLVQERVARDNRPADFALYNKK